MTGLRVNKRVVIPLDEIDFEFSTSGGPGGQHANRSATRVEAKWNVATSRALGQRQRERVMGALGRRIDSSGVLRIRSDRYRSQLRNREDALEKLAAAVAGALVVRRRRVATAPTRSARDRRLRAKRRRSEIKKSRRPPLEGDG